MIVNESLKMGKIGQLSNPILIKLRNIALNLVPSGLAVKMVDKFFTYRVTKLGV